MNNISILIWGIIFGSIGLAFFVYDKKQKSIIPMLSGIGLMVFPYFISNIYIMILSGIVLVALPYFIRIWGPYSKKYKYQIRISVILARYRLSQRLSKKVKFLRVFCTKAFIFHFFGFSIWSSKTFLYFSNYFI